MTALQTILHGTHSVRFMHRLVAVSLPLSLLAAVAAATPRPSQDDGLTAEARALEQTCSRGVDAPQNGGRAELERALAGATDVRATFLRGCQHLGAKRWDAAAKEFEAAVQAEQGNPVFHYWAGRAHADQAQNAGTLRKPGLARKTKSDFERALALAPGYIAPREALVQYALAAPGFLGGGADRARGHAAELTKRNPYRGGFSLATVALRTGDTTLAMRTYQDLAEQFPDSGVPRMQLGMLYLARSDLPAAWRLADEVERDLPHWAPAKYGIGRLAAETGEQMERGEAALLEYVAYQPKAGEPTHAMAYFRLGMIYQRRGDRDKARGAYQQVLAIEPGHRQATAALARLK